MQASDRYGALLAAGRAQEAEGVAELLLEELNDSRSRARLVETAFRAGKIEEYRERHLQWLQEITLGTAR